MNLGIEHKERFAQRLDFSGLIYKRGIRPTDIDASLDFNGKLFVFIEAKHDSASMRAGQKQHLEYLCTALHPNASSYAVLCSHSQPSHEDIRLAFACVSDCYFKDNNGFRWSGDVWKRTTVKDFIDKILAKEGMKDMILKPSTSKQPDSTDGEISESLWLEVMGYPLLMLSGEDEIEMFKTKLLKGTPTHG